MLRWCCLVVGMLAAAGPAGAEGWPSYGRDPGGTRFAPDRQITPGNVGRLEIAWTHRSGDMGAGFRAAGKAAFEATPVLAAGRLYFSTPFNVIVAVDAATGAEVWRHDARPDPGLRYSEVTSRGVAVWGDPAAPGPCAARVFSGTIDGRLVALDAATGKPCADFGRGGAIDLTEGVRLRDRGDYQTTSPPALFEDLVIIGSAIGDNRAVDLEFGIVRAYDARTGRLAWSFDPIPRTEPEASRLGWSAKAREQTGAGNVWSIMSVDVERGLVFLPTSSPSPDFYGGERPGDNLYANSVVALDARTGRVVWHQQLVRHDLWDYDVPAQPVLAEVTREGRRVPAVIQATKMGLLFVFHRETGAPLFEIEERPVPASDVPGEAAAPTQRFPVKPPPLVSHKALAPDDAFGLTFWDRGKCAEKFAAYRSEGIYTPPSLKGTLMLPSYAGGTNWGGIAFDEARGIAFANVNNVVAVVRLVPQAEATRDLPGYTPQRGTPYALSREIVTSPIGMPCNAPPWGTLAAVDMNAGTIKWQVPLGTTRDLAPWPWFEIGVPNFGGPIVTASGLVFIAATTDNYLRAFDAETGKELWKGRLPAGGQATPMTYTANGRQFVVIAAGGHGMLGTDKGDYLLAFALPR
ncbi:pyrroloquinoline quinone-dependent dehydrogenase [Desertibaculum subflavum]|uniref:pyrroloquinoline quinone-dependent dehydrogenase n=1 Tax=Desertibaculum subflavum TaxID=2268458 RepID=UPI000E661770